MMMKNACIIFLGIWMLVQTPLGELLKLPLLVEHFIKHQQAESASIFDFLEEHYTSGQHDDNDAPEDERLPFKTAQFYSLGSALVTPFSNQSLSILMLVEKKIVLQASHIPQKNLSSIFHPPRV